MDKKITQQISSIKDLEIEKKFTWRKIRKFIFTIFILFTLAIASLALIYGIHIARP